MLTAMLIANGLILLWVYQVKISLHFHLHVGQ